MVENSGYNVEYWVTRSEVAISPSVIIGVTSWILEEIPIEGKVSGAWDDWIRISIEEVRLVLDVSVIAISEEEAAVNNSGAENDDDDDDDGSTVVVDKEGITEEDGLAHTKEEEPY